MINVLLIGGGGREHALARAISGSEGLGTLFATDRGNPGISALSRGVDVPVSDGEIYRLGQFCDREDIGLVVIGPEDPLAQGWGDALRMNKQTGKDRLVFGPGARGAKLEADKAYARQVMRGASIPMADGREFRDHGHALEFLRTRDEPYVVKAAGLAKGKGVVVPETIEEGERALHSMMIDGKFGDSGRVVVLEERLKGTEVSVLALLDGETAFVLPACQDHKRLLDGDRGPNTGGMGAFCPSGTIDETTMGHIEGEILVPLMDSLRREEIDFRGVLYMGIMLTPGGPKVLEFNVRFGDPECQTLMARLGSDPLEMMIATASGGLDGCSVRFKDESAVTVVLASEGYPESPRKGDVISGVEDAGALDGVTIDLAGVVSDQGGALITNGGRVLSVTALGDSIPEARDRAYGAADLISFPGKQVRTDIGSGVTAGA